MELQDCLTELSIAEYELESLKSKGWVLEDTDGKDYTADTFACLEANIWFIKQKIIALTKAPQ